MSFTKNTAKHTVTEIYAEFVNEANIQSKIKTIPFAPQAREANALLRKVRYTARKLIFSEIVLGTMFAVLKKFQNKTKHCGNSTCKHKHKYYFLKTYPIDFNLSLPQKKGVSAKKREKRTP